MKLRLSCVYLPLSLLCLATDAGPREEFLQFPLFGKYRIAAAASPEVQQTVVSRIKRMGGQWNQPPTREVLLFSRRDTFTESETAWIAERVPPNLLPVLRAVCQEFDVWAWPVAIPHDRTNREALVSLLELLEGRELPEDHHLPYLRLVCSIYATNYFYKFLGEGRRLLADDDRPLIERSMRIVRQNATAEDRVLRQWAVVLEGFLLCMLERPTEAQQNLAKFESENLTWEIQFLADFIQDYCRRTIGK